MMSIDIGAAGLNDQQFINSVKEQYKQYLPEGESFPFKNLDGDRGIFGMLEANENLEKAMEQGEHGGLEYEAYRRFLGILGKDVVRAAETAFGKEAGQTGIKFLGSAVKSKNPAALKSRDLLNNLQMRFDPDNTRGGLIDESAEKMAAYAGYAGRASTTADRLWVKKQWRHRFQDTIRDDLVSHKASYTKRVEQDRFATAASRGDVSALQDIADPGASLDGNNTWRQDRPLFEAAKYGQVEMARVLLDAGANQDLTSRKTKGLSLIGQAAMYSQPEFFKFLLTRGVDPKVLLTERVMGRAVCDVVRDRSDDGKDKASQQIWKVLEDLLKGQDGAEQGLGVRDRDVPSGYSLSDEIVR